MEAVHHTQSAVGQPAQLRNDSLLSHERFSGCGDLVEVPLVQSVADGEAPLLEPLHIHVVLVSDAFELRVQPPFPPHLHCDQTILEFGFEQTELSDPASACNYSGSEVDLSVRLRFGSGRIEVVFAPDLNIGLLLGLVIRIVLVTGAVINVTMVGADYLDRLRRLLHLLTLFN